MRALLALILTGLGIATALAQTQQQQRPRYYYTYPPRNGAYVSGGAVPTYPSNNPFSNPIGQGVPPAASTSNPYQNYFRGNGPVRP